MSAPLKQLLSATAITHSSADPESRVESLEYDSRKVKPGSLFFALPGEKADGKQFAAQAAENGAIAIVSEAAATAAYACPSIVVQNARLAMGEMAAAFNGNPAARLQTVGITGTNGKTTTAFLTKHLLDADHRRSGLIGTVKYIVGDREIDAPRTTPESVDLQKMLGEMRDEGSKAVVMEVSSHALTQHRVAGIEFDAGVFTNLTQDHLDYHKTMDAYFDAKALLFENMAGQKKKKGKAIINTDDKYGRRLAERFEKKVNVISFGLGANASFRATDIKFDANGSSFGLTGKGRSYLVRSPLIGSFNIYNSLAALAAASAVGVELRAAVAALANAPQVPGRLQRVPARRNFQVYVDYAHTDDALRNALRTLRELRPVRLITVFGCGGDRDRAKRPLMAAAADELSDWVIATSDNPRTEDPDRILADIARGFRSKHHETVVDREAAIRRAVALSGPGDIILIAGKGHETYQEFADKRITFDDVAVATWAVNEKPVEN